MITQTYDLNLIPGGIPVRVPVSQHDTGSRDILFHLYSGSAPFSVPAGASVTVEGIKPDRKGFSYVASANEDTVTVALTEQMTAVSGNTECQLTVRQSGKVLGTANFLLAVERAALPEDSDLSKTELSTIEQFMNQSQSAAEAAAQSREQAAESAKSAADSAAAAKTSAESASNHTHSASAITDGTLSSARLPTVPISKGGTNKTSWTANRLLYPSSSTAFTQLAHPTTAGAFLRQNTSGAPYWTAPADVRSALGAAPSGYGLGEVPAAISDLDSALLPGFYGFSGSAQIPPVTIFGTDNAVLWVERAGYHIKQTLTIHTSNSTVVRWGTLVGGEVSFEAWEWVNPSMTEGFEYRTTERWLDSAVYTKLVDFGTVPSKTSKTIKHETSLTNIVRVSGSMSSGRSLPYWATDGTSALISADKTYIAITTTFNSSANAYAQIWYTKD